jgi:uncharacterized protein (DUF2237 family)
VPGNLMLTNAPMSDEQCNIFGEPIKVCSLNPSTDSYRTGFETGPDCAAHWREALEADAAPRVVLAVTHEAPLKIVRFADLRRCALDLAELP